jgi:acyl carrier protein
MQAQIFDRSSAMDLVIRSMTDVLEMNEEPVPDVLDADTTIVGPSSVLDSLGVVSLIVEIEQRLELEHDLSITLASDRAMSQRSSPFRTVGVLADYMLEVINDIEQ